MLFWVVCLIKTAQDCYDLPQYMAEAVENLQDSPVDSGASGNGRRRLGTKFDIQKQEEISFDDTSETSCEDGVDVYCPNQHLGCEWSGSLTNVVEHMNYDCQYSPVASLLDENIEMPMIIMMRDFEQ